MDYGQRSSTGQRSSSDFSDTTPIRNGDVEWPKDSVTKGEGGAPEEQNPDIDESINNNMSWELPLPSDDTSRNIGNVALSSPVVEPSNPNAIGQITILEQMPTPGITAPSPANEDGDSTPTNTKAFRINELLSEEGVKEVDKLEDKLGHTKDAGQFYEEARNLTSITVSESFNREYPA